MASEKDKRIELLEAQRRDDVATNRGLVARIAELEQEAVPVSDPHPDTARLDWLDQRGGALAWFSGTWAWMDDPDENTGRTLREAIDAAREAEGEIDG